MQWPSWTKQSKIALHLLVSLININNLNVNILCINNMHNTVVYSSCYKQQSCKPCDLWDRITWGVVHEWCQTVRVSVLWQAVLPYISVTME